MKSESIRKARARTVMGLLALAGAGMVLFWCWSNRAVEGIEDLRLHMEDLGRVAVIGEDDLLRVHAEGTTLLHATDVPGLEEALAAEDEEALVHVLSAQGIGALLADGREVASSDSEQTLQARLSRYEPFEQLQAVYLSPRAALYVPRTGLVLHPPYDFALAYVARGILGGAEPPRVQSFPEPLRRIRNVEVMVMLKGGDRPRLWRSARGSSIARALLTASIVARQRWSERESAMGGPLLAQLGSMDVEVFLLDEDGTLGSRSPAFIERVFTDEHGVAFDHLGTWRYLLPDATKERGEGSAVRAYEALFDDSDMEPGSAVRQDVRLYRLLARRLARSPAPQASSGTGTTSPWPSSDRGALSSSALGIP